jgi:hypothetical protein
VSPLVRYILLVVAASALAFGLTYALLRPAPDTEADEMVWMQNEFHLTPSQASAIERLHADYQPICMEHCKLIKQVRDNLASSADKASAQAELSRLEAVCREATQAHLQRVAAVMSPEQGARFLALVAPKVSGQKHDAPLGLK